MDDGFDTDGRSAERIFVSQIADDRIYRQALQQRAVTVRSHETTHGVAAGARDAGHVRTDKARSPGDEKPHCHLPARLKVGQVLTMWVRRSPTAAHTSSTGMDCMHTLSRQ